MIDLKDWKGYRAPCMIDEAERKYKQQHGHSNPNGWLIACPCPKHQIRF